MSHNYFNFNLISVFVCSFVLTNLNVNAGSSQWLLQPREDCQSEKGATALLGYHHCRGQGLSLPSARLYHQRAASGLPAQRGNH